MSRALSPAISAMAGRADKSSVDLSLSFALAQTMFAMCCSFMPSAKSMIRSAMTGISSCSWSCCSVTSAQPYATFAKSISFMSSATNFSIFTCRGSKLLNSGTRCTSTAVAQNMLAACRAFSAPFSKKRLANFISLAIAGLRQALLLRVDFVLARRLKEALSWMGPKRGLSKSSSMALKTASAEVDPWIIRVNLPGSVSACLATRPNLVRLSWSRA
mmetsp:Transcript_26759/g.84757  ORF Transcript_26759/g.84757 Transcript_26759/m.84757 type:complete len:216 (+) Transcript_26759:10-657(+)